MTNLALSLAMDNNPRASALVTGAIQPEGVELHSSTERRGPALFRYQLQTRSFDVSDMSMTAVFMMADRSDESFVALPVFTMRHFFHTTAVVRDDAGIDEPTQLKGKRIGIPGYQSAASLWCRGALQHEYGVSPTDVSWFTQQAADADSGEIAFIPPTDLDLNVISSDQNIDNMLLDGEIDAIVNLSRPNPALFAENSGVRRLFPDPAAEGIRYFRKTGIYPTNHCVIVKREVVEQHPWVVMSLYNAFLQSNALAAEEPARALTPYFETGLVDKGVKEVLKKNLFGYGVAREHLVLDTFAQYCYEQGYTSRQLDPREVFAPETADF